MIGISAAELMTDEWFQKLINGEFEPYGHDRILNPEVPTESPIEDELEHVLCKSIPDGSRVTRQFKVPTYRGVFRIDFVVHTKNRLIGFECDGRQYHDWRRDIFRDAVILSESDLKAIYRLEGPDIYYRLETALHILGQCRHGLFSERAMENLWALSECRDDVDIDEDEEGFYAHYTHVDHNEESHDRRIHIRRLSRDHRDFQFMVDAAKRYRNVRTENLSSFTLQELHRTRPATP